MKNILVTLLLIALLLPNMQLQAFAQSGEGASMSATTEGNIEISDEIITPLPKENEINDAEVLAVTAGSQKQIEEEVLTPNLYPTTQIPSAEVFTSPVIKKLKKKSFRRNEKVQIEVLNAKRTKVTVKVTDRDNNKINMIIQEKNEGDNKTFTIFPPENFKPGEYKVQITDGTGEVTEQDFAWGVLAINMHKSVYQPQDEAKIAIAVLDDKGAMVCNADVALQITSPTGKSILLSTKNGLIKVNSVCESKDFTLVPDYEALFQVTEVGTYDLALSAVTVNGSFAINDSLLVKEEVPFEVERLTATRIYPKHVYPVNFSITANEDFSGIITEVVPHDFVITPAKDGISYSKMTTVNMSNTDQNVLGSMINSLAVPFKGEFPLSLGYGERVEDAYLKERYSEFGLAGHDGIDFALPSGTPVVATDKGEVVLAEKNSDYGTTVVIKHTWGKSYYGHLSILSVEKGQMISQGDEVGLSGNTGLSTGSHLHFGIKFNQHDVKNGYFGKVDPLPYLALPTNSVSKSDQSTSSIEKESKSVLGASLIDDTTSVKVLQWDVTLKKGEKINLGYQYKSPEISPQFYTLGPLSFTNEKEQVVFEETRKWQIAVDAVGDGTIVYGEGTVTTPRYSNWTTSFSAESSLPTAAATIRHSYVKAAPNFNEMIAGFQTTGGTLYVQRFNGTNWTNEWNVSVGDGNLPRFDIVYEQTSGDAMVLYPAPSSTTDLAYRIWNGSSWSTEAIFDTVRTTGAIQGIQAEPQSGSNNIGVTWADANLDLSANFWDGTSNVWKTEPSAALATDLSVIGISLVVTSWSFDLAFESVSGDMMVIWGLNLTLDPRYAIRTAGASGTWGATATGTSLAEEPTDLEIASDPDSDYIAYVNATDDGNDADTCIWDGSTWANCVNYDTAIGTVGVGTSNNAIQWIKSGTQVRAVLTYDDAVAGIDWKVYNKNTNTWATNAADCTTTCSSDPGGTDDKLQRFRRHPTDTSKLMFIGVDSLSDLYAKQLSFDGTNLTWSNADAGTALETSVSSITGFAADFAYVKSTTARSGGAETPTLDKLMRHGKWFNSSGVRQPFTF